MKIIGIGGTNGSGKDTLAHFLQAEHSYLFVSISDILRKELERQAKPIERENLKSLSAQWRRQFGHGVLIDKAVQVYETQRGDYHGLVISSLRNPGEAEEVQRLGGKVVWLDADPKLRYQRIYSRQRSTEDQKTFEQFLAEEQAEMQHHNDDDATLNMAGVKDMADIIIANQNNDIEQFKATAQKALSKLL